MARTPKNPTTGAGSLPAAPQGGVPVWVPPALYAALTVFLFREFIFSDLMLFGSDTESLGYMARAFFADALRSGDFPGWNPRLLGGTPFLASLAGGDSLYPPSLALLLLTETHRALGWKLVLHVFLAGWAMYGWSRALGVSPFGALVAGTGYLVAPFLVTLVFPGHDGKIFVTALAPLLFWAVEAWFANRSDRSWVGIALVVALVLLTTHFQMAYFLFGAAGIYAAVRAFGGGRRERTAGSAGAEAAAPGAGSGDSGVKGAVGDSARGRGGRPMLAFGLFLAASFTGAAAAGVQLVPAVQYITEFSRRTATTTEATSAVEAKAYASSWSLHPEEAASLVIPEFVGNSSAEAEWARGTYWGRNPFKLNHEYLGLGILLLAVVSFVGAPRRLERYVLAGIGGVALFYALGAHTPVWHVLYALLPGIQLFRAPSMTIFLTGFAACTLAGFGVDRILVWSRVGPGAGNGAEGEIPDRGEAAARRGLLLLAGAAGALLLVLALAGGGALFSVWNTVLYPEMTQAKAAALDAARPFIVRGSFLALLIALAVTGVAYASRRSAWPPAVVTGLLVLIVAVDGIRVDAPFLVTRDVAGLVASDPNIQTLQRLDQTQPPFRVLDMNRGGQEVRAAMFGLDLASGHHPNDLARYRELTGMVGSGAPVNLLESANLRRILNVRYIVWPVRQMGGAPEGLEPVSATQLGDGQIYEAVYEVGTLPRARLVAQAEVVPDGDAVERLMDPAFDVAARVVVPEPPPVELGGGVPQGEVEWVRLGLDRRELRVETDRASLLVLAENWYPAWQATVDGESAPLLRVNHTLQAVPLGPGSHTVELVFRSGPVRAGLVSSVAAVILMLGVAGRSLVIRRRTPG